MGVNSLFVLPAQMVDATLACRLIAGVSNQKFFSGVDSSAARPARAALERWRTGRFLAESIAAGADSCFRSCHAARDFVDRRSRPAHPLLP